MGYPRAPFLNLDPLFFLIYINEFPKSSLLFKFTLFGDDSTATCSFLDSKKHIIQNKLNEELGEVHQWVKFN